MSTKIEWVNNPDGSKGETWNPFRVYNKGVPRQLFGYHCTKISIGCKNCYAERFNKRFGNGEPFDSTPVEFGIDYNMLERPYHWKKPRRIFVESMGDLFHKDIRFEMIREIFKVMFENPRHIFIILTKRPERALAFCKWLEYIQAAHNIWVGITAEIQKCADERLSILVQIPAAVKFVSVEPILESVDIEYWLRKNPTDRRDYVTTALWIADQKNIGEHINWVICGGETGPGARPIHPGWIRLLRDQCIKNDVPFFFKSWGEWYPVLYKSQTGQELLNITPDKKKEILVKSASGAFNMRRVGKKEAGRLIDGREWNQIPKI